MAAETLDMKPDPRIARALNPVSEAQPAGSSARGEPEYDLIEDQIRKLESEGPSAVNWRDVAETGLVLLESRSKDLLVGAWVAFALLQTEKLAGLAVGGAILRGMVDQYWDGLSPPVGRERARVAALEWLSGRATPIVSSLNVGEESWPLALSAYDDLTELDRLAGQKLTKEQVAIGELIRALRPFRDEARRGLAARAEAEQAVREAAAKASEAAITRQREVEVPPAQVSAAVTPGPTAGEATAPTLAADIDVAIAQLPEMLRSLATQMRDKNLFDPRAYSLARVASWLRIRQLPPEQGGRTGAASPQAEIAQVEAHRAAGKHRELVSLAEEAVWSAPFWYDGHRLAGEALRAIGSEGQAAEAAIAGALAGHLRRFPGLASLAFADGTPFASSATLEWLGASAPPQGGGSEDLADTLLGEARASIAAGRAPEGLERLTRAAQQSAAGRDRLMVLIAQAAFCLEVGLVAAALPILEHAIRIVDQRDLETWEPSLACRVAELRFRALSSSEATRVLAEDRRRSQLEDVRARVSRLDLAIAARIMR